MSNRKSGAWASTESEIPQYASIFRNLADPGLHEWQLSVHFRLHQSRNTFENNMRRECQPLNMIFFLKEMKHYELLNAIEHRINR